MVTWLWINIRTVIGFGFICFYTSCSTPVKTIFSKKTPHEQYESRLSEAKLNTTNLGILWFGTAQKALQQPAIIQLPYKETGYFAAEQPNATGYRFIARRGEIVNISVTTDSLNSMLLFADLWQSETSKMRFLKAADTTKITIEHEIEENGSYQLRIQPELLKSGEYTVIISATGSLAFPVPAESNPKIGSFWGANRDNGTRTHEGIDIFGKFRTPVVAATDGYITSTRENNLGGKVIFLRPHLKNYSLYYAHLDSQIAKEGQEVKTGDIIGLMGNTGNARTTPTHLHFGIYTNGGAIDPLPFVDKQNEIPKKITASLQVLGNFVRTNKATMVLAAASNKAGDVEKVTPGTALQVAAATSDWYKVLLPNGKEGFVNDNNIIAQQSPVRTYTTDSNVLLLDNAIATASPKKLIVAGTSLSVYGSYQNFYLVKWNGLTGWIKKQ